MRVPEHPVQLFTTNQLILRCVVELIPEVDSLVAINSQWSGHSALTDERRVIVSDVEGIQLVYETSVTFSSLKSSDSGSYVCSANVSPHPSLSGQLIESSRNEQTINIVVGMCMYLFSCTGFPFKCMYKQIMYGSTCICTYTRLIGINLNVMQLLSTFPQF